MEKTLLEYFSDENTPIQAGSRVINEHGKQLILIIKESFTPAPDKFALLNPNNNHIMTDLVSIDSRIPKLSELIKAFNMKLTSPDNSLILPFGSSIYINNQRYILTRFTRNNIIYAFLTNQKTGTSEPKSIDTSNKYGLNKNEVSLLCDLTATVIV